MALHSQAKLREKKKKIQNEMKWKKKSFLKFAGIIIQLMSVSWKVVFLSFLFILKYFISFFVLRFICFSLIYCIIFLLHIFFFFFLLNPIFSFETTHPCYNPSNFIKATKQQNQKKGKEICLRTAMFAK